MKIHICTFHESYTEEELWLDEKTSCFTIKMYHYGWIDDEQHYDGEEEITASDALSKIISYNKLFTAIQYSKQLHLDENIDLVLAQMKQKSWINNPESFKLLADPKLQYYILTECEYAVYFGHTFFSVKNGNEAVVDFAVVKRILHNADRVTLCEYSYFSKEWVQKSINSKRIAMEQKVQ